MFFLISQNKGHLWSTFKKTQKLFCMIKYLFLSTKETGIYIFISHVKKGFVLLRMCSDALQHYLMLFSELNWKLLWCGSSSLKHLADECSQLLLSYLCVSFASFSSSLILTSASPRYFLWQCSWSSSTSHLAAVHMLPHQIQWHRHHGYFWTCIMNILVCV